MFTENPGVRSRSMRPGGAKGKSASCRAPNGRSSSQSITPASSTGRPMRPIGRALLRLRTHYTGRTASPGYHCAGKNIVDGRGIFCLSVGAVQTDDAVARTVLTALAPAGLEAALAAAERLEADRDDALAQCRLAAERARYEAQRAERRYRAVDAENPSRRPRPRERVGAALARPRAGQ